MKRNKPLSPLTQRRYSVFWQRQRDYLDRIASENRNDPMLRPKAPLSMAGIPIMLLLNVILPMLFPRRGETVPCVISAITLILFLIEGGTILYIRRDEWNTPIHPEAGGKDVQGLENTETERKIADML